MARKKISKKIKKYLTLRTRCSIINISNEEIKEK
nr:MAG TPA: hypothetical protein [Caudoviricetes sp.]